MRRFLADNWALAVTGIVSAVVVIGGWQLLWRSRGLTGERYTPVAGMSDEYNRTVAWMVEELSRKKRLDHSDINKLAMIVTSPPKWPELPPGSTDKRIFEPLLTYENAIDTISIRLRSGPEVTRSQYDRLKRLLVGRLDDSDPNYLMGTIQCLCYSRLVSEPDVRRRVERFYDSPDLRLKRQAERQLEHFDMITARVADGSWRERFATIIER